MQFLTISGEMILDIFLVQEDGEGHPQGANDNDYWNEQRADLYRTQIPSMFDRGEEILRESIEAFQAVVSESSSLLNPDVAGDFVNFWMSDDIGQPIQLASPDPTHVWHNLTAGQYLRSRGFVDAIMGLLSIPASEAACERVLWHLRRAMYPYCMGASESLLLTRVRAIVSQ
jgi:hypothetical protein